MIPYLLLACGHWMTAAGERPVFAGVLVRCPRCDGEDTLVAIKRVTTTALLGYVPAQQTEDAP